MKTKKETVWVLTREHNEYDQHGVYFECVFAEKPSLKGLAEYFSKERSFGNVMEAVAFLEHLREGGGRQDKENVWYNLDEVIPRG